jgi:molybdopterin-guanine dinucleotide biosynthesis protein A
MPFVTAAACRQLVRARAVAFAGERLQPLLGVYPPAAVADLRDAAERGEPLTRAVERLALPRLELPAPLVRSVDTPAELAAAEAELRAQ